VRLGGKVEDRIDRVVRDRALDRGPIADIGMDEREPCVARHTLEVRQVPRIRQGIEDDDFSSPAPSPRGQHPTREVAAMKPAPP